MKRTQSPRTVFFQPPVDSPPRRPTLYLRHSPQDIRVPRADDEETKNLAIRSAVDALIKNIMTQLPEASPQRAIFSDWHTRFSHHPLQTAQQRHHAAVDLEWLFYEQIETQASLRMTIEARQIDHIARALLDSADKASALREKYRAKADNLLRKKITQETLQLYRECIGELFYEIGCAVSDTLASQRESAQAEGNRTETVIHESATKLHEACMQSASALSEVRNQVVQTYKVCLATEKTHQETIQALAKTINGSES